MWLCVDDLEPLMNGGIDEFPSYYKTYIFLNSFSCALMNYEL
jgi:hypothetical protein